MDIVMLERESVGMDVDVSCFAELGELTTYADIGTPDELRARLREAELLIANKAPLTPETLAGAGRLKLICLLATGYDNCDLAYCRSRGIRVCNAVDYSTAMVAQHTLALALALSQKLVCYDRYVKSGAYSAQHSFSHFLPPFRELDGKTWGIVGLGRIGRRVAGLAAAFGCRVRYTAPQPEEETPYLWVDKETLLAESDVLSLHCPLNEETRHFIDAAALRQMKRTAFLVNVSRGPVVDQRALYEALQAGEIAGAALDVLEKEPLPADDPLLKIQDSGRLLITPHLAWASVEARQRCVREVYENIRAVQQGRARNLLNG